ncbi:hypothetical protein RINTHH_12970 [Richelia intracellularis HH01]|uniref:Uncharacterized protein n=1 Tax=Richelia intracellularis HH01 TaxID=1165094 RepID=M1WZB7_9NOST|nr:hypothetical protein [Richelia intracellularis]CCH67452.1 hypothetical protein RINTHH_12970 [Richelia intracellularis HH01]
MSCEYERGLNKSYERIVRIKKLEAYANLPQNRELKDHVRRNCH